MERQGAGARGQWRVLGPGLEWTLQNKDDFEVAILNSNVDSNWIEYTDKLV